MTIIAGLSPIRFETVIRIDARNYPALKSLGVSHKAAFAFTLDGKEYWGECFRTRGVAGYSYDSAIRTNDKRGRSYAMRESAMPAIREAIALEMGDRVADYAAALDAKAVAAVAPALCASCDAVGAAQGTCATCWSGPVRVESPRFLYIVLKGDKGASYLCEGGVYSTHPQGEYAGNTLERARLDVDALNSRYLGAADKPYRLVASPAGLELDGVVRSSLEQWQLDALDVVAPVQVVAPAARAITSATVTPVRPSDPLRRALVAEGRTFAPLLDKIIDDRTPVAHGKFQRDLNEWHNRLADFRARLGWYWEARQASRRPCQCPDCTC